MLLWPIFRWFEKNPAARWVAGIGAALAAFWGFMTLRDRRRDKQAKEEGKREVIEHIREQTDEAIKRVEEERRTTADLNDAERLRLASGSPHNAGRLRRPEAD